MARKRKRERIPISPGRVYTAHIANYQKQQQLKSLSAAAMKLIVAGLFAEGIISAGEMYEPQWGGKREDAGRKRATEDTISATGAESQT